MFSYIFPCHIMLECLLCNLLKQTAVRVVSQCNNMDGITDSYQLLPSFLPFPPSDRLFVKQAVTQFNCMVQWI